ncbi:TatD family hydrolase [Candidatus Bipolaricaulota bacterium]|nr:TatD family hydrolase [Candidatus Bipolaricaulota bacterium]
MKLNLIDTHAHVFMDHYDGDREKVIARAGDEKTGMINMGLDIPSSKKSVEIAENHEGVYAGVGFHPHEAKDFGASALRSLLDLSVSDSVVAVGEIGLDYYRDNSPREQQRKAFRAQLDLAVELGLPVSVHNRSSTEDTLGILKNRDELPSGVMHSFFGDYELAGEILDLGFYLGLSGPLTFDGESDLRDTVGRLPLDRLLLETDSPFLTPEPYRGKRNEPAFVSHIGEELASIKGIGVEEVGEKTTENARRLFSLDER